MPDMSACNVCMFVNHLTSFGLDTVGRFYEKTQLAPNVGTLQWNFRCPFVRELMLSLGLVDVSKKTLLKVQAPDCPQLQVVTQHFACGLLLLHNQT